MKRILALIAWLALVAPAAAQSTTGSIAGTVLDDSRRPSPGAVVVVTSEETGLARAAAADADGAYRVLDVPPGRYGVRATRDGFAPAERRHVTVTVGEETTAPLVLSLAVAGEPVRVEGGADSLDTGSTSIGGVVERRQISDLPLNGRSYLQLATLEPGVVLSRGSGREFTGGYSTTQISMAGARPEHTGYLLDGSNIADISDKAPAGLSGGLLGVDAIREFSVRSHGYSAEFGRAAGGIVSAVTRSGTNAFSGSVFAFHRDAALDARNYFDAGDPPAFRRDQFGVSAGGPLRQNSLFFFGSYEGLRDRKSITRIARLPDANAHLGLLPDGKGGLARVAIAPAVQPYLDLLFPVPDGRSYGDGTAELAHAHSDPLDEHAAVARIDWHPTNDDAFMIRFAGLRADASNSLEHPLFRDETSARTRYLSTEHQRVLGSRALNTLRASSNLTFRDDDVRPTVTIPQSLLFTADPHFGAITVIGMTMAGSTGTIPASYEQTLLQLSDTFTLNAGSHLLKAGIDWQHYDFGGYSYSRYGGEFRFRGLQEFLTLRRSATAAADRFTGNMPGTDTARDVGQHYVAVFVQDEWRPRADLTLDAGLRYERVTTPREAGGRIGGLLQMADLESGPRGVTPGTPLFDNPSGHMVAPRVGLAWTPVGGGRTVVRAGAGVFEQPLTVSYYRGTVFRVFPWFAGVDVRQPKVFGPGIQDVLEDLSPESAQRRSEFIAYDARQPYLVQWHASVEQRLSGGVTGEVGYLGSIGRDLPFYGDPNSAPAERLADGRKRVVPGATVRYPSWGRIRTRVNAAESHAHALVAGVRRRFERGLLVQGSYTYSRSFDTWSGGLQATADFDNGAGSATDWWDPRDEYGPSTFNVRHTLVVNGVWELPWGRHSSGLAGVLSKGWQISGMLQLASGLPFTPFLGLDRAGDGQSDADLIQKPDQVGPVQYPRTADQWFDPSAFALPAPGYYGNARRNSLWGPGLKLADVALFKTVPAGAATIQLRLEAFNAFNWVNLGLPDASALFNADGTRRPGAGRITTTATPARQLQVGLRVTF